ncbi:hypothetical protein FAES_3273 [Fibrella aestuarina BUZ 2]|uniref:Uncharacterized protein n=2 Tax=Fibrella TaxID=861914 RepID=I0KAX9_9BACT|nr:hypothetical protein FAES_3273 [Fibrella aestuarina BUZ 2]
MLNGWSAEYALRITPVVNDQQYLHSSLHWTFPQAYYSILFTARALLLMRGCSVSNDELVARKVASMVVSGLYPQGLNYYLTGTPHDYNAKRLQGGAALFSVLTQTRDKQLKKQGNQVQTNPKTAMRSPRTGEVLDKLGPEHYKALADQTGPTCFFNVLHRLRISSNQPNPDVLTTDELDVRELHACLVELVNRINQVHEAYLAKALGLDNYQTLVAGLPGYLNESFVNERLNTLIPILAK